jgi:hypothetical protein
MRKTDGSPFTLSEVIEIMTDAVEARRRDMQPGGLKVSYHGPLAGAPPSVLKDVQRWIDMLTHTVGKMEELV